MVLIIWYSYTYDTILPECGKGLWEMNGTHKLTNGIIKAVGHVHGDHLNGLGDIHTIDAHG